MSHLLSGQGVRLGLILAAAGVVVPAEIASAADPRCPQDTAGVSCFCVPGQLCLAVETSINNPAYVHFRLLLAPSDTHANVSEGTGQREVKSNELTYVARGANGSQVHAQACNRASLNIYGSFCGPWQVFNIPAPAAPSPIGMDGIDLPGSDIGNLITRNQFTCQQACSANGGCRAWTFVKTGSKCWLKNAVPTAVKNGCCISGVMTAARDRPVKSMKKATTP